VANKPSATEGICFRRYILSYMAVFFIPLIIIIALFYASYRNLANSTKEFANLFTNKNVRIMLKQVRYHINILERLGTWAGEPFVKHVQDKIWELRPGNNRILFLFGRITK
jgi:hypothetical protein